MKWLLFMVLVLFSVVAFAQGHEGGAGTGFIIDKEKFEKGLGFGAIQVFDEMEYEKEFIPTDLAEFNTGVKPLLEVIKGKLPRTGAYLERIFTKGIHPRWYFVKFTLKKLPEQDPTDLEIAYERVQIGLFKEGIIKLQEVFYNGLTERGKQFILIHEGLRAAIGWPFYEPGTSIASLAALLLHKNLSSFSPKDLADEMIRELNKCSRWAHGKGSPLLRLVESDQNLPGGVQDSTLSDTSVLSDGVSPTVCMDETDQCFFLNNLRGTHWSRIGAGSAIVGERKTFGDAVEACKTLTWGKLSGWRLPTFSELLDGAPPLRNLSQNIAPFGRIDDAFWVATTPWTNPWSDLLLPGESDDQMAWSVHGSVGEIRAANKEGKLPWVCIRDDWDRIWEDVSTDIQGAFTGCKENANQCAFRNKRSHITYSEVSPNYKPRYRGERRPGDEGEVSRTRAFALCHELDDIQFAGLTGWRMPTSRESREAREAGLYSISLKHESMGVLTGNFWNSDEDRGSPVSQLIPTGPLKLLPYGSYRLEPLKDTSRGSYSRNVARFYCVTSAQRGGK